MYLYSALGNTLIHYAGLRHTVMCWSLKTKQKYCLLYISQIKLHYLYDSTSFAVCPPNHFGPNCAKCQQRCQSCDPITGKCTQCQGSLYGEYCNLTCPVYCLDLICNHKTGACNGCKNGFKGKHCEQKTTSFIVSPGIKLIKKSVLNFRAIENYWYLIMKYLIVVELNARAFLEILAQKNNLNVLLALFSYSFGSKHWQYFKQKTIIYVREKKSSSFII